MQKNGIQKNGISANKPTTEAGNTYHLDTPPNFFQGPIVIAGAPGRARRAAEFLDDAEIIENAKRGLVSVKGKYNDQDVYFTTSGMGVVSVNIILPEVLGDDRAFKYIIRLGSCGSTIKESKPGDLIVVNKAYHWDGASIMSTADHEFRQRALRALQQEDWFSPHLVSWADPNMVALVCATAKEFGIENVLVGEEYTAATFDVDQGRFADFGNEFEPPPFLLERHLNVMERARGCYSMEAAGFYRAMNSVNVVAVNAVYAQRHSNEFEAGAGDDLGIELVLKVAEKLSKFGMPK